MAVEDSVRQLDHPAMEGHYSMEPKHGVEAAAQSWEAGAPLILVAGKLTEAADDFTSGLVGFALKDASGTEDTAQDYIPALEELTLEATLEDQNLGDHALTQASVGVFYALRQVAATGDWYVDFNDTTNDAAFVEALVDPVGTVQGRVRIRIKRSVVAWA